MFLIVHASVGAVLGEQMNQPVAAFGAGVISHFLVDMIPHGDEVIGRRLFQKGRKHLIVALAVLDVAAASLLIITLLLVGLLTNATAAVIGAVGAVLPDVLQGFSGLADGRLWPRFVALHQWSHRLLNCEVPTYVGFSIQALALIVLLTIITT